MSGQDKDYNQDADTYTTVLNDGYDSYQDTVVDQSSVFDPSIFGEKPRNARASSQSFHAHKTGGEPYQTAVLGVPSVGSSSSHRSGRTKSSGAAVDARRTGGAAGERSRRAAGQSSSAWPPDDRRFNASRDNGRGAGGYTGWTPELRQESSMKTESDSLVEPSSRPFIAAIVVLAAVGIVAIIVALALAFGPRPSADLTRSSAPIVAGAMSSSSSQPSEVRNNAVDQVGNLESQLSGEGESASSRSSSSSSSSSSTSSSSVADDRGPRSNVVVGKEGGHAVSEAKAYETLLGYYEKASEYDKQVSTCADEFNANYAKEDKSVRSAKAQAAANLKSSIKEDMRALDKLEMPILSKNIDAYGDICKLYEYLYNRVNVIDKAWQISLKYDKPEKHKDEILEPIASTRENGNNRDYTRFKNLYPNVKLVKP